MKQSKIYISELRYICIENIFNAYEHLGCNCLHHSILVIVNSYIENENILLEKTIKKFAAINLTIKTALCNHESVNQNNKSTPEVFIQPPTF